MSDTAVQRVEDVSGFVASADSLMRDVTHGNMAAFRGNRDIAWALVPGIARWPFKAPEAFCQAPEDQSAERILFLLFCDSCASLMPAWSPRVETARSRGASCS